jgi:regulator of replication initiation timing
MNKKKELIDKINKLQQRITSHDYQIGELQNLVENLANLQI